MEFLLRFGAIIVAVIILVAFLLSIARTTLLNRHAKDPMFNGVSRFIYAIALVLTRSRKTNADVARFTVWILPLFMLFLILTWFTVVLFAFALLYWQSGAEQTFGASLLASGSALTTLGFETPSTVQGKILAICEGIFGLMIIIFFFTFIPGYQSSIVARDVRTAWLYERAGQNPTGYSVLHWLLVKVHKEDVAEFWGIWEDFFRELKVTHVLAPEAIYTPSSFADQSWVISSHAILDAAAIYVSSGEEKGSNAASMCLHVGARTMRELSITLGLDSDRLAAEPNPRLADNFDAVVERLKRDGVTFLKIGAAAKEKFTAAQAEYSTPLAYIAKQTLLRDYPTMTELPVD